MESFQTLSFRTLSLFEYLHTLETCNTCVGGIVVSIAAFQAVDPGSIPGQRINPSLRARVVFAISLRSQQWSEEPVMGRSSQAVPHANLPNTFLYDHVHL